ncbi:unnamed protein product, partial [marine sediment metagenome]
HDDAVGVGDKDVLYHPFSRPVYIIGLLKDRMMVRL